MISANSYGSVSDVAGRASIYTNAGYFDTGTIPTLANVETYIDEVSATVNGYLAEAGFTVPVTQADAKKMIASVINDLVSDRCDAANRQGRFFQDKQNYSSMSVMMKIREELRDWVQKSAAALEALGADRAETGISESMTAGVINLDFADHNETVY